jgi:rod shape-determining protein MreB
MLKGLDLRLARETDVPVRLVRQPLEAVVLGAGRMVENYEELADMFMASGR